MFHTCIKRDGVSSKWMPFLKMQSTTEASPSDGLLSGLLSRQPALLPLKKHMTIPERTSAVLRSGVYDSCTSRLEPPNKLKRHTSSVKHMPIVKLIGGITPEKILNECHAFLTDHFSTRKSRTEICYQNGTAPSSP
ncbi:uncharacterized protein LOC143820742 [Paroedura picta]|uniref:uncharacterized protein LOC143820742 n=1 Tax=Paroedura picta TaxID=143630 RepID=UPI0040567CC3